jgi:hypothetical protein
MQLKIQANTSHQIHSIFDLCEVFDEQMDKFDNDETEEEKNLKLIIDFDSSNLSLPKKQMEIENIEYKRRKKIAVKEVDLRKKKKPNNSMF